MLRTVQCNSMQLVCQMYSTQLLAVYVILQRWMHYNILHFKSGASNAQHLTSSEMFTFTFRWSFLELKVLVLMSKVGQAFGGAVSSSAVMFI